MPLQRAASFGERNVLTEQEYQDRQAAAARQNDEATRDAADCLCQDLTGKLTGHSPSDRQFRAITRLGERIVDGGFGGLAGIDAEEIMMRYDK